MFRYAKFQDKEFPNSPQQLPAPLSKWPSKPPEPSRCFRNALLRNNKGLLSRADCGSTTCPRAMAFQRRLGLITFRGKSWETKIYRRKWSFSSSRKGLGSNGSIFRGLAQCLAHRRCSTNIYFMTKWKNGGSERTQESHFAPTALPTILSLMSSGKSLKIYVALNFSVSFCTWSTCHIRCPATKDQLMLCAWIPSIHLIKFWESRANWIISHDFFYLLVNLFISYQSALFINFSPVPGTGVVWWVNECPNSCFSLPRRGIPSLYGLWRSAVSLAKEESLVVLNPQWQLWAALLWHFSISLIHQKGSKSQLGIAGQGPKP